MRDDAVQTLFAVIFVVLVLALSISCGIARYDECRRFHPMWYCLGDNSK